jgi:hypothetical protein
MRERRVMEILAWVDFKVEIEDMYFSRYHRKDKE